MQNQGKISRALLKLEKQLATHQPLTKHIPRTDRDLCEAQMMLYALKEDMDPEGPEATREINEMKRAVKLHNRKFST
jgi:hypothetical protein